MKLADLRYLFLNLNVWLCVTSILMVVATALALSTSLSSVGPGLALPPLLFYFIYVEDRRNVSSEDRINRPRRTQLVEQYRRGLLVTEVLALAGYELLLAVLIWTSSVPPIPWLLLGQLPLGILFAYGSLKRYPTFDSIAVGTTWAFVIVFSVLLSTARPITVEVGAVFAAWVLIAFAGVESRNLQDVKGDGEANKTTLAGYLGVRKTRALEATLKTTGVVVFWSVAGAVVAALVVAYLLLLRLFRQITRREIARAGR